MQARVSPFADKIVYATVEQGTEGYDIENDRVLFDSVLSALGLLNVTYYSSYMILGHLGSIPSMEGLHAFKHCTNNPAYEDYLFEVEHFVYNYHFRAGQAYGPLLVQVDLLDLAQQDAVSALRRYSQEDVYINGAGKIPGGTHLETPANVLNLVRTVPTNWPKLAHRGGCSIAFEFVGCFLLASLACPLLHAPNPAARALLGSLPSLNDAVNQDVRIPLPAGCGQEGLCKLAQAGHPHSLRLVSSFSGQFS